MTHWATTTVWYHVYPLGFVGAEKSAEGVEGVHHRLPKLEGWLDHVAGLGVDGLLLGPIFASSTHGYDTVDHFRIDPRLGDDADFDKLVAGARDRGLRVVLDGVFNHVGREHPAFREVLSRGPSAPHADWFRLSWPRGEGAEPDYADFEGHRQLVALAHERPAVQDYLVEVMTRWLDRGVAGWRLDAAYCIPPEIWAKLISRVRQTHPDAFFLGEVIHGDYPHIVSASGMSTVTQYELWKATWSALKDGNFHELAWTLRRHDEFLSSFTPQTFVGNHDVTRIATQVKDRRRLPHAHVILMTTGGIPSIYYGDERGWEGVKENRFGGDDAIRPAFPEASEGLGDLGRDIEEMIRGLVGMRKHRPWLARAKTEAVHLDNRSLVYATTDGTSKLLVALSLEEEEMTLPAPGAQSILLGSAVLDGEKVRLPPMGWAVLSA